MNKAFTPNYSTKHLLLTNDLKLPVTSYYLNDSEVGKVYELLQSLPEVDVKQEVVDNILLYANKLR